ncbi:hypothetical protein SAMN05216563_10777 [Phytobacter palmae]|nr:hypothetical protein SAMN05216563_10777 [Phytobacter palmae]
MVLSGKPCFLCGLFVIISLLLLLVFLLPVSHMNWLYMTCSPCTAKNVAKNVFSLKGLTSIRMVYIFNREGSMQNKDVEFVLLQTVTYKHLNFLSS